MSRYRIEAANRKRFTRSVCWYDGADVLPTFRRVPLSPTVLPRILIIEKDSLPTIPNRLS